MAETIDPAWFADEEIGSSEGWRLVSLRSSAYRAGKPVRGSRPGLGGRAPHDRIRRAQSYGYVNAARVSTTGETF
jgi:hypothetical protein